MRSIKYAWQANADLEDIIDYAARAWGAAKTQKYIRQIRTKTTEIANGEAHIQPLNIGKAGMYKAHVNRHIILFEKNNNQILIIQIVHQAVDISRYTST